MELFEYLGRWWLQIFVISLMVAGAVMNEVRRAKTAKEGRWASVFFYLLFLIWLSFLVYAGWVNEQKAAGLE